MTNSEDKEREQRVQEAVERTHEDDLKPPMKMLVTRDRRVLADEVQRLREEVQRLESGGLRRIDPKKEKYSAIYYKDPEDDE